MHISKLGNIMLPTIKKSNLLENIDNTLQIAEESTQSVFQSTINANAFGAGYRFKSPWVQRIERDFDKNVKVNIRGTFIVKLNALVVKAINIIKWVRTQVEQGDDILKDGLRYTTLNVLQVYEVMRFFIDYSRKLLLQLYYSEQAIQETDKDKLIRPYSKAEMLALDQSFPDFIKVAKIIVTYSDKIETIINNIPDVVIDTGGREAASVLYRNVELDPMGLGIVNTDKNPIWFVGSYLRERAVKRYQAALREQESVELRILQLKMDMEHNTDPALLKSLEYNQKRLSDINYELAKEEV